MTTTTGGGPRGTGAGQAGGSAGYPGRRLGLSENGRGSVATFGARLAGVVLDAIAAYLVGLAISGVANVRAHGVCLPQRTPGTLCHTVAHATFVRSEIESITFLVMVGVLLALTGRTPGMLLLHLQLVRLDGRRIGWAAVPRTLLMIFVVPALWNDQDRRGLHDRACGTVVVRTR